MVKWRKRRKFKWRKCHQIWREFRREFSWIKSHQIWRKFWWFCWICHRNCHWNRRKCKGITQFFAFLIENPGRLLYDDAAQYIICFFSSLGQTHVVIRMSKAVEGAGGRSSSGGGGQAWAGLGGAEGGQPASCRCLSCWGGWRWWWPILEMTINHDYFVFQELESKLEASRLRESQLLAEVESVRFF